MDAKTLYELLDTVWVTLPDDAARQQFWTLIEVYFYRGSSVDVRDGTARWFRDHNVM